MIGEKGKGINICFNVLKNIFHLLIHIDRRPLCDKRGRSFVEVSLISNPQAGKDIPPFPNNRFPKRFLFVPIVFDGTGEWGSRYSLAQSSNPKNDVKI